MWKAKNAALGVFVAFCCVNLSGCNTVQGFGADMRRFGHKIQRKIDGRDSSEARTREVRHDTTEGGARTGPQDAQSASPAASSQEAEWQSSAGQEPEKASPDVSVDNTQIELDRMYEEQTQRRAP